MNSQQMKQMKVIPQICLICWEEIKWEKIQTP